MLFDTRATQAVEAMIQRAITEEVKVTVTVVDAAGMLRALRRMDGCLTGPAEVSQKKARTAALFGFDSHELGPRIGVGGDISSIELTNGGMIGFGGGMVLRDGDTVIGGIGVSGASTTCDMDIAQAGLIAFMQQTTPA